MARRETERGRDIWPLSALKFAARLRKQILANCGTLKTCKRPMKYNMDKIKRPAKKHSEAPRANGFDQRYAPNQRLARLSTLSQLHHRKSQASQGSQASQAWRALASSAIQRRPRTSARLDFCSFLLGLSYSFLALSPQRSTLDARRSTQMLMQFS